MKNHTRVWTFLNISRWSRWNWSRPTAVVRWSTSKKMWLISHNHTLWTKRRRRSLKFCKNGQMMFRFSILTWKILTNASGSKMSCQNRFTESSDRKRNMKSSSKILVIIGKARQTKRYVLYLHTSYTSKSNHFTSPLRCVLWSTFQSPSKLSTFVMSQKQFLITNLKEKIKRMSSSWRI